MSHRHTPSPRQEATTSSSSKTKTATPSKPPIDSPKGAPPFIHTEELDTTHGRFDQRSIGVYPFEPLEANLRGCRSLAVIRRTRTTDPEEVQQVAFFTSDHPPEKGCARSFAGLARGHWAGCGIRNHWMREDKTRSKNHNINCALAGLRVCLIAIKGSSTRAIMAFN